MTTLYDDADLYDLVAPRDPVMEQFYLETAGGAGRQVLELACGSGRFTLPPSRSGASVTACDLSEVMLTRARERAADQGLEIDFRNADMRNFSVDQKFDAVVIAAKSLMHLHSQSDFGQAFSSVRRHLKPHGILVFDVFVPSAHPLSLPVGVRRPLGTFKHAQLGDVSVEEMIEYDPLSQVSRADWYWSAGGSEIHATRLELRQIYPQELPLLLALGSLKLVERYGGFDRRPFDRGCHRQVCIAALQ